LARDRITAFYVTIADVPVSFVLNFFAILCWPHNRILPFILNAV
jgi:hypothetical protein